MEEPREAKWQDLGLAWNAVIEFTAAVAVYGIAGWYADKWLNTGHVLFILGLVLGQVLGVYVLVKRSDQTESMRAPRRSTDARP